MYFPQGNWVTVCEEGTLWGVAVTCQAVSCHWTCLFNRKNLSESKFVAANDGLENVISMHIITVLR